MKMWSFWHGADPSAPPSPAAATTCANTYRLEPAFDYVGGDIVSSPITAHDVEECCASCERTAGCNAFTFVGEAQQCWLKQGRRRARAVPEPTLLVSGHRGRLKMANIEHSGGLSRVSFGSFGRGRASTTPRTQSADRVHGGATLSHFRSAASTYGRLDRRRQERVAEQLIAQASASWRGVERNRDAVPLLHVSMSLLLSTLDDAHYPRHRQRSTAWLHMPIQMPMHRPHMPMHMPRPKPSLLAIAYQSGAWTLKGAAAALSGGSSLLQSTAPAASAAASHLSGSASANGVNRTTVNRTTVNRTTELRIDLAQARQDGRTYWMDSSRVESSPGTYWIDYRPTVLPNPTAAFAADSGAADSWAADSGAADLEAADSGAADLGAADLEAADSGAADLGAGVLVAGRLPGSQMLEQVP